MKKFKLLLLLIVGAMSTAFAQDRPNIVLLFVDDYGWSDIGYRNESFLTPNLDQFKNESLEFTRAYIPTPTCSPSRASMLTGKEAARIQMPRHIGHEMPDGSNTKEFGLWSTDPAQRGSRNWLPLEEVTYAEKLKELGYYNVFLGKWHLGHEPYHPIHQGFDEQIGVSNFGHPKSYYAPFFKDKNAYQEFNDQKDVYLTEVMTDTAVHFLENYDKPQPFMMTLWYYTVHGPHIGKKELVQKYVDQGMSQKYAEYHAMVESMDQSVGTILKTLKRLKMDENTVVIVTSDQGSFFENTPLAGGKRYNTLGEGGARVPMLIKHPALTKGGSECATPIQTIDIFPTVMEIASGKTYKDDNIQGKSLMPALKGKKMKKRNLYFMRSYEDQYAAIMQDNWKLVKYHSGKFELFNVVDDISEEKNMIDVEIKRASKMKQELLNWENEVYAGWKEVTPQNSHYFKINKKKTNRKDIK
ncbi:sulfatase [Flammeovirga agarivorans]|uniref:Sulfatase n=1 Tax=Flammeovirga agarivorans TaxID=2726742 RepID=A0A7X8SNG1_9BACT|nr:sulfatase [Flammeovirga agarivorans]NLR93435.1 sulfatase [Flammeovirga agarivorans]